MKTKLLNKFKLSLCIPFALSIGIAQMSEITHTVKKGETILDIALKYKVSTLQIRNWNKNSLRFKDPFVGQKLIINIDSAHQQAWHEAKILNKELFLPKDEFETTAEYNDRLNEQKKIVKKLVQQNLEKIEFQNKEKHRIATEKKIEKDKEIKDLILKSLEPVEGKIVNPLPIYDADKELFINLKINIPKKNINIGYVSKWDCIVTSPDSSTLRAKNSMIIYTHDQREIMAVGSSQTFDVIGKELTGPYLDMFRININNIEHQNIKIFFPDETEFSYTYKQIKIPRSEAKSFKRNIQDVKITGFKQLNKKTLMKTGLDGKKQYDYDYFNLIAVHPITGNRYPFGPKRKLDLAPVTTKNNTVIPPNLSTKVVFLEPNGNGFLDAEEKGKLKVSIINNGKGSAFGVLVNLDLINKNNKIAYENSKIIGEISPGETKLVVFEISSSKDVKKVLNEFIITAKEAYGYPPDPFKIIFETYPFIPPLLSLEDFGINTPNRNNEIKPQTTTEVQVRIQNKGQGIAEDIQLNIILPNGTYFTPNSRQSYNFPILKPGEFKDLDFSFTTSKVVESILDLSIGYIGKDISGSFPLKLEVSRPQQTINELMISGNRLSVEFENVSSISVDIEKDIPKSKRFAPDDLAIIFGIEIYKNVSGVSFAKRDAEWVKIYFEKILGIQKQKIYFETDRDVSLAEFRKVFTRDGWLDKRIKPKISNVFVYFAGHGAPDIKNNKGYLIPYDGDPNYASQSGYGIESLYEELLDLDAASVTVFLDACFSGSNRESDPLFEGARPVYIETQGSINDKLNIFTASGGKEISSSWPEKKHGLFSYYLMKGMRGDADINKDKKITYGELGNYIKLNVSEMAGMLDREQTPEMQSLDPTRILIQY